MAPSWWRAAGLLALALASCAAVTTPPPMIPFFPEGEDFYFDLDPSDPLYSDMAAEGSRLSPSTPTRRSEKTPMPKDTSPNNQLPVMCGTYSISSGEYLTFATPYFPALYSSNFQCKWTFEVAGDDQELEMTCSEFNLAKRTDFLKINSDGTDYVEYKRGNEPPSPITTSGGILKAHFKSDRKRNAGGFKCVVRSVAKSEGNDIPLSHPSCGKRKTKIINGQEAVPNEFPWQVWLVTLWTDGKAASCGGSIINEDWIVTAAHCLSKNVAVSSIRVTVGAHYRMNPEAHDGYNVFAAQHIIHQQYNFPNNDIAVIRLQSSLTFSETVGPACLAPRSWVSDDFVGALVLISGWGQTEEGTGSDYLRYVESTGVSLQECRSIYGSTLPGMIMCTDSSDVEKACYGDSGGPVTTAKNGRTFLVGLVSFGRSCTAAIPDGHCRVAYMIDWIESSTGLTFNI